MSLSKHQVTDLNKEDLMGLVLKQEYLLILVMITWIIIKQ